MHGADRNACSVKSVLHRGQILNIRGIPLGNSTIVTIDHEGEKLADGSRKRSPARNAAFMRQRLALVHT